jgi:hypothetical protein
MTYHPHAGCIVHERAKLATLVAVAVQPDATAADIAAVTACAQRIMGHAMNWQLDHARAQADAQSLKALPDGDGA